jgi:hypothetical protein
MVEWLAGNRARGTSSERINGTSGISLDGSPQTNTGTTATSLSVSISVGDNNNKALIVCVTQQSGSTTSVKVGSNSFTNVDIQNGGNDGNGTQRTEIWYLLDDDITNNASNQIDWVGSAGSRVSIGVYSLYNVDQTVSGNFVSSSAYGTASTTTGVVNSVGSDDFILDILSANSSTQPVDTLTEGWNVQIVTNRYSTSQYNSSPSTNNNMFYSNVTGAEWAWSGVRIKPIPAIPAMVEIPAVSGGWKEIARVTSNDTDVTSIPDKRYYMVLSDHGWNTANAGIGMQINGDTTGGHYPRRYSQNGGNDATPTSETNIFYDTMGGGTQTGKRWFMVQHIANKSDKEKLIQYNMVFNRSGLGKGVAPDRIKGVAKWTDTSESIDRLDLRNFNSGTITSDSEVVVLGWDEDDTHTTNFWEELASVDLSGGSATTLNSGTISAKKYLWIQTYSVRNTSGAHQPILRFNGDSEDNYAVRRSNDGGTDGAWGSQTKAVLSWLGLNKHFTNSFLINNSANEKLMITHDAGYTTANAGTAPQRSETVSKWANTSSQITSIQLAEQDGFTYDTQTIMKIWGSN